ncbi:MAG: glycogen debranching protein, partial [Clostridia bacterium]|nr:glycogen debranching protein [Clostridia bacterium]
MLSPYRVYRYDQLQTSAVTAGTHAVLIGAQNGLFPDLGFNVEGEMGGLWAGEKKVCDGFFFAIDDVPLVCADACEVNPAATAFHYRMQEQDLHIVRRQYIPDGVNGCVIELTIEN